MSRRTRYMQSQLNRLMLAETISLTSVFVIPIGFAMGCLIFRVRWVGFGVVIAIFLEWVPAVNPMTTILLVGPYRRQLMGLVSRKKIMSVSDSDPQEKRPRIDRRRSTIYQIGTHKSA
ncbi:hypothetical protein AAVH_40536 [Aphelenchoides avenae]|nr:hypothetical protein AAVH_40536 [Aphelenchus avenae]